MSEILVEPIWIEEKYLRIPEKPSLGVELREDATEEYPHTPRDLHALIREDGSTADWWTVKPFRVKAS